jgi:ABC-type lipoprotein release transport system permease subunit
MVIKRSLANWRLLSSVVIGVLLASAIMAGTVIYFDSLRDLALESELSKHAEADLDVIINANKGPTTPENYALVKRRVDREFDNRLTGLSRNISRGGRTSTFFATKPGQEDQAGNDTFRSYFVFLEGADQAITIVDGVNPREIVASQPDGSPVMLEGLVPADVAAEFGIGIGDAISLVPYWDETTPYARVVVVGLFERSDPDDPIWRLDDRVFRSVTEGNFITVPFLVSESTFLNGVGGVFGNMDSSYGWLIDIDAEDISSGNANQIQASLRRLESRLGSELLGYQQITELDDALSEYDRRLLFSKLQMFVVLILITVVVLYYVVTLSALVAEQRKSEILLLRGRGATSRQILAVFVLEGSTIAALAVITAPFLAALAISFLGFTPAFSDLSGGERLPVRLSQGAFIMSALGGILSLGALMIPAISASRQEFSRQREDSARPSQLSFFQRYYLDVMLLVVSIVLFRQLTEQGSLAATNLLGEVAVNQLLLAVPAITLVAAAMVLLRLFPVVLNLASRALSPHLPPGLVLGLWQMARNPTHYARLALLLILMAGLGIFAASFGGTLERSFEERVLYSSGSDVRVIGVSRRRTGLTSPFPSRYERLDGVTKASPVLRTTGSDLSNTSGETYTMLGVDTGSFADVAWFREDFADDSMHEIMLALKGWEAQIGLPLPDDTRSVEILLKSDRPHPTVRLSARLKDSNGRFFTYPVGFFETSNWTVMEFQLFEGRFVHRTLFPAKPLTLVSIAIAESNPQSRLSSGSLLIDSIRVRRATGEVEVLETFRDVEGWNTLQEIDEAVRDRVRHSEVSTRGDGALMFAWSDGRPLTARGIYPGSLPGPIPVVASESFIRGSGHSVGDELQVSAGGRPLKVVLIDTVDFFPTLDTFNEQFLIVDLDTLLLAANLGNFRGEMTANEMWLNTDLVGSDRAALVEKLRDGKPLPAGRVIDRQFELSEALIDPLVLAGWRALLLIAFGAILVLSSLGFLVHAYVSFRNRELQFALMRTIGFNTSQLVSLMWLEQALVIAVGMALGTWMGGRLGSAVMPFLGHDDQGSQVIPPFVIEVNWTNLLVTYAAMSVIFTLIILGVIFFVRRMSLSRALRIGDI